MAFKQQGTGFTGVRDLVNANKNNKLGGTILKGVQGDVQDVNNRKEQALGQFNQDVNNAKLDTDQNKQKVSSTLSTALQDPSKVSEGDVSAFDTFRKGSYSGPTQLNNFSNLQAQGQKVQQLGQDVNNKGGQFNLLKQYVGGNQNYGRGAQNLDATILGQTGQPQLKQVKQVTQPVMSNIQQAGTQAGLQADNARLQNQAFAQNVDQQLSSSQKLVDDSISQQLQQYQQQDVANKNAFDAAIKAAYGDNRVGSSGPSATPTGDTGPLTPANLQGFKKLVDQGLMDKAQFDAIVKNQSRLDDVLFQDGPVVNERAPSNYNYQPGYDFNTGDTSLKYYANRGDAEAAKALKDFNIGNLLSKNLQYTGAQNLDKSGVTSQQQAAQLNALAKLAGQNKNFSAGQYQGGKAGFIPSNMSVAPNETAPAFDKGLVDQINQAQSAYEAARGRARPLPTVRPGMGGGGTVICTELHRQGLLDDKIYALDAEFGKQYRKDNLDAYRGYLIAAAPVVKLMKKSPNFARAIAIVAKPWYSHMAHKMDPSNHENSALGQKIQEVGTKILPIVYKVRVKIKAFMNKSGDM